MQVVIRFCQKEIHIALTPCMHIVEAQQILFDRETKLTTLNSR
jgi:hypothetical protein